MPIEALTYAALGARLNISPKAARSLAKRLHLPSSLSDDGKALVSVDLAEIQHRPRPPSLRRAHDTTLAAKIAALEAEVVRLGAQATAHRADFEHERERADRLLVELLQANADTMAARETMARLEGTLRTGRANGPTDGQQSLGARRLGHLAADLVAGDRKASR
jgi:hypothetical protein